MEEKEWYVVNTYSGHENKVKTNLEMRIETMGMEDFIYRVVVPEQIEVEYKEGQKSEKMRKMFPGYILIEMRMSDEAWYIVRNTPGVTGFIGSSGGGAKPIPLLPDEVDNVLGKMGINRVELDVDYKKGDKVILTAGAFQGMNGTVDEVDSDNNEVVVLVDLFGQATPVEIGFEDLKRA